MTELDVYVGQVTFTTHTPAMLYEVGDTVIFSWIQLTAN